MRLMINSTVAVWSPVISATSHRRQSSRRQTNSATTNLATRVGQHGDNLVRLSVCFVKQAEQESRAIAEKPCNVAVNFEYGVLNE